MLCPPSAATLMGGKTQVLQIALSFLYHTWDWWQAGSSHWENQDLSRGQILAPTHLDMSIVHEAYCGEENNSFSWKSGCPQQMAIEGKD